MYLEDAWAIAPVKLIMEITPNLHNNIDVKGVVDNFFTHGIKDLRNDHAIAMRPCVEENSYSRRLWNYVIDESEFVLYIESHRHGPAPSVIIVAHQMMGNKVETWMIPIVKKIRTPRFVHLRSLEMGKIQSIKLVLMN